MIELFQYDFMRHAIAAAILASVACGVIGSYVVVKRLVFISGGISHAAFGGIGLAYYLGLNPYTALVPFSLLCAVLIAWLSKKTKIPVDTSIGILWAVSMALGVVLIGLKPGYAPDLFGYLFGNILTVPITDLIMMVILVAVVLLVTALFYKEFLAVSFDEEYAEASGLPVHFLYYLLLCLIALTVVMMIRIAGSILVIAMLTLPPAIAKQHTRELHSMMKLAILVGIVITLCGLWLSFQLNIPSGASIVILASVFFVFSSAIVRLLKA